MRSRLLGPDGKYLDPPTLADLVREQSEPLLPIVEVLSKKNKFLQEIPWQAKISPILDAKGRPYLRVVK